MSSDPSFEPADTSAAPVLVTGGSGFIGSRVVRALAASGRPVRVLLRTTSDRSRLEGIAHEPVIGDILDPGSLDAAARGCAAAIHAAGPSSWTEIEHRGAGRVIVDGAANVAAACCHCGVRRLLFVSSGAAIDASRSPRLADEESPWTLSRWRLGYSEAKRQAERSLLDARTSGLEVVIVNPAEVYGEGDSELVTARNLIDILGLPVAVVPRGGTGVVHVDDVAAGIIAALERGEDGRRYILSGENLSCRELARLALELAGRRRPVLQVPGALLVALARLLRWVGIRALSPEAMRYASLYWYFDARRAREELGAAFRSARETLAPTIGWLRDEGRI